MGKPDEGTVAVSRATDNADAPPAYTSEVGTSQLEAPAYGDGEKDSRRLSSSSSTYEGERKPGKFPAAINAYYQKSLSRTFHLGEHRDAPLFAVKSGSGWSRQKAELTIFDGPSSDGQYPVLAAATRASMMGRKYDITLPPLPGSGSTELTKETIESSTSWSHQVHKFSIEVGHNGQLRREDFEWRGTRSEEVRGLAKEHAKWLRGWKLVRLSSEAFRGPGGERSERDTGTTSDGKEVVAVWAHNNTWSATKGFKFRYLGSALAGELGERFDTMALATAVHRWCLEVAANAATAASGAA